MQLLLMLPRDVDDYAAADESNDGLADYVGADDAAADNNADDEQTRRTFLNKQLQILKQRTSHGIKKVLSPHLDKWQDNIALFTPFKCAPTQKSEKMIMYANFGVW